MNLTKLSAAKLWLISTPPPSAGKGPDAPRDLPYLSTPLYALVPVESSEVPTMTVDERWRLYIDPEWLDTATVSEVGRHLAHLVWHLLADHAGRARSLRVDAATASHWTNAADASLHGTLRPDRLDSPLVSSPDQLELPAGRSAEEYYAMLSRLPPTDGSGGGILEPADGCGSGCDGIPRSHELPADADGGLELPDVLEIRRRVAIEYREHATQRGTSPGDAWRWTMQILEPRIAWEPLLGQAVRRAVGWASGRGDYTYSRPSRRSTSVRRIVLPGMRRPVPRVSMVVDTSYSVDDALLGRALGEVDGALAALGIAGSAVTVYACDAAVHTVQKVRSAKDARLAGGGGTDLRTGIAAAAADRPRPEIIVVFTDGYTPWPTSPPPGCTVIVALLGRAEHEFPPTPAWATRVECFID